MYFKPDIAIIIETKLKNDEKISMPGFHWYGLNRKGQLRSAKCGSGGVGFFIKTELLRN